MDRWHLAHMSEKPDKSASSAVSRRYVCITFNALKVRASFGSSLASSPRDWKACTGQNGARRQMLLNLRDIHTVRPRTNTTGSDCHLWRALPHSATANEDSNYFPRFFSILIDQARLAAGGCYPTTFSDLQDISGEFASLTPVGSCARPDARGNPPFFGESRPRGLSH